MCRPFLSYALTTVFCVAGDELGAILTELSEQSARVLNAYLAGATRDATFNRHHRTTRFAQVANGWLDVVQAALVVVGRRSWRYREGRRNVWVVETYGRFVRCPPSSADQDQLAAWARGYFDAEGGVPCSEEARFYIQLSQKDRSDLDLLRQTLERLGIRCGRLHNPSRHVNPHYWRFYVRKESHPRFAEQIGSWHPRKRHLLSCPR
jgi:LAGLIDADG DNA endonuclease family protein